MKLQYMFCCGEGAKSYPNRQPMERNEKRIRRMSLYNTEAAAAIGRSAGRQDAATAGCSIDRRTATCCIHPPIDQRRARQATCLASRSTAE